MQTQYTLSNNATIIECKRTPEGPVVVLARTHGYHPFVTWMGYPQATNPHTLECAHGHYFADLSDAVEHFVDRCKRNGIG